MLTAPALTFVFLCVVVALGAAFVGMFCELEQISGHLIAIASANVSASGAARTEAWSGKVCSGDDSTKSHRTSGTGLAANVISEPMSA